MARTTETVDSSQGQAHNPTATTVCCNYSVIWTPTYHHVTDNTLCRTL